MTGACLRRLTRGTAKAQRVPRPASSVASVHSVTQDLSAKSHPVAAMMVVLRMVTKRQCQPVQDRCSPGTRLSPAGRRAGPLLCGRCQLLPRVLVKLDAGDREVLLQVPHGGRAGNQQDVGRQAQGPGKRDLGGGAAKPLGGAEYLLAAPDQVSASEATSQPKEGHEGDPP